MIENFPTIVSFYTSDTLYQLEVQNLIASCSRFDLEMVIEGVPSFGSWELNCAYKPFFILKKLKELKTPLLWVDADAVFTQKPQILDQFDADISVRINTDLPQIHPSRIASGTVYVNHTQEGMKLVFEWAKECRRLLVDPSRNDEFWDQIALRNVLEKSTALIKSLPLAYVKIFDHPEDNIKVLDPVITHYQASRRLKNLVNLAFKSLPE